MTPGAEDDQARYARAYERMGLPAPKGIPLAVKAKFAAHERLCERLLANAKAALPALCALLDEMSGHWGAEDGVYRFYHQSFKVYHLQDETRRIVDALAALDPRPPSGPPRERLNAWFREIIAEGTGKRFDVEHNKRWLVETRPIVEAFLHARYFLDMAVKYAKALDAPPQPMPSGWAALLTLFDLR